MDYEGTVTFDGKPVGGVLDIQLPKVREARHEIADPGYVVLELERMQDDPGQQAIREKSPPDYRGHVDLVVSTPPTTERQQSVTFKVWVKGMGRGNPTTITLKVSGTPVVS